MPQKSAAFTAAEISHLQQIAGQDGENTSITLNMLSARGELSQKKLAVKDVLAPGFSEDLEKSGGTAAVDFPVILKSSENIFALGREAFGLTEWQEKYPEADGRGTTIAIVDDGLNQGFPGLKETSTHEKKISKVVSLSAAWQLPLTPEKKPFLPWKLAPGVSVPDFSRAEVQEFEFTPCGFSPKMKVRTSRCLDWAKMVPRYYQRLNAEGLLILPGFFVDFGDGKKAVLMDLDGNAWIDKSEIFNILSVKSAENLGVDSVVFKDGRALAFDVYESPELGPVLTVAVPHVREDLGHHGEGAASVAAGFYSSGSSLAGVAPGAQIFDVQFGDAVGGRRYTFFEVARALKTAASFAKVVNFSYSLYFSSPAAQVGMKRFLDALLSKTEALFLFSAGNQGPGIGSMNQSLIYPEKSLVVGAFLDSAASQQVFGSAVPMAGFDPTSSRGPGPDGAMASFVTAPVAALMASQNSQGLSPYNGTSAATPALAGIAARIVSAIQQKKLILDLQLLKTCMLASINGNGMPQLLKAFAAYEARLAEPAPRKTLEVSGPVNSLGIQTRGIYIRGDRDLAPQYEFHLNSSSGAFESLAFAPSAPWIHGPKNIFMLENRSSFLISVDFEKLPKGVSQGEVRIVNAQNGELRQVIPVTVIKPHWGHEFFEQTFEVPAGGMERIFLEKPRGAQSLVLSMENEGGGTGTELCGTLSAYNPWGGKVLSADFSQPLLRQDFSLEAGQNGVFEIILEGQLHHRSCAKTQQLRLKGRWLSVEASLSSLNEVTGDKALAQVKISSHLSKLQGDFIFSNPLEAQEIRFFETAPGSFEWATASSLDLSSLTSFQLMFESSFQKNLQNTYSSPLWTVFLQKNQDQESLGEIPLPLGKTSEEIDLRSSGDVYHSMGFVLNSFDYGIEGEEGVGRFVDMILLGRQKKNPVMTLSKKFEGLVFDLENPAYLFVTLSHLPKSKKAAVNCRFTPVGFQASVDCGWIYF